MGCWLSSPLRFCDHGVVTFAFRVLYGVVYFFFFGLVVAQRILLEPFSI